MQSGKLPSPLAKWPAIKTDAFALVAVSEANLRTSRAPGRDDGTDWSTSLKTAGDIGLETFTGYSVPKDTLPLSTAAKVGRNRRRVVAHWAVYAIRCIHRIDATTAIY